MALSTPILNRDTSHLLFAFKTPHSPFQSLSSLRLTKPPLLPTSLSLPSSLACCITRVTTVPVEYAPPAPEFEFHRELSRLKSLRFRLADCKSLRAKIRVIDGDSRVKRFFNSGVFSAVLASLNLSPHDLFLLKCLVAAGQEHVLGWGFEFDESESEIESARSSVKSAFYAIVEMIEKLDVNARGSGKKIGLALNDEDFKDLNKLLKNLGEVEHFYKK